MKDEKLNKLLKKINSYFWNISLLAFYNYIIRLLKKNPTFIM